MDQETVKALGGRGDGIGDNFGGSVARDGLKHLPIRLVERVLILNEVGFARNGLKRECKGVACQNRG